MRRYPVSPSRPAPNTLRGRKAAAQGACAAELRPSIRLRRDHNPLRQVAAAEVVKIKVKPDTREADALVDRAKRLKPSGPPLRLDPATSAVQFLRGVGSRATMSLPAFYLFLGSNVQEADACSIPAYPGAVLTHWMRFSAINTITLSCRKVFDHAAGGMTGAGLAKSSDLVLRGVAEYWAKRSKRTEEELGLRCCYYGMCFVIVRSRAPCCSAATRLWGSALGC